jgi:hypothetical protein
MALSKSGSVFGIRDSKTFEPFQAELRAIILTYAVILRKRYASRQAWFDDIGALMGFTAIMEDADTILTSSSPMEVQGALFRARAFFRACNLGPAKLHRGLHDLLSTPSAGLRRRDWRPDFGFTDVTQYLELIATHIIAVHWLLHEATPW